MIETEEGKVLAYPLEGIVDILHGWLVKTRDEVLERYERYYKENIVKKSENKDEETQRKNQEGNAGIDKEKVENGVEVIHEGTKEKTINIADFYENDIPDTVIGVVSLPLVTRNPYLDFYEKFLGIQKQISGLNIIVVSASPFYHENKLIFSQRLFKAILHELGHAFGLDHCSENCVMNPPATIDDWDSRIPDFCPKCFLELKRNVEWKANKCDNTSLQRGKEDRERSSTDA
ncbi:peptidase M54 [Thermococcus sp. LS2]|nr:peptidase M54 [Thermococcus sp. LS2]